MEGLLQWGKRAQRSVLWESLNTVQTCSGHDIDSEYHSRVERAERRGDFQCDMLSRMSYAERRTPISEVDMQKAVPGAVHTGHPMEYRLSPKNRKAAHGSVLQYCSTDCQQ